MKMIAIKGVRGGGAAETLLRPAVAEPVPVKREAAPAREYRRVVKADPLTVAEAIRTYTLRELQAATGVSARAWCVFINQGLLQATKVGRTWLVTAEAFQKFMQAGHHLSARCEREKRRQARVEAAA